MDKESWRKLAAKQLILDLEAAMGKEPRELATKLVLDLLSPLDRSDSIEWVPALVAIEHTKAPEHIVVRKTVLIGHDDDSEEEQKAARNALLKIRWLTSGERSAIMAQLGRRLAERNAGINKAQAATLVLVIEWVKEITKIQGGFFGERPRGGRHDQAYEVIAENMGMKTDNLKRFIQRYGPKGDERKAMQERGRQWAHRSKFHRISNA
jgi:hypothetical protein